MSKKIFGIDPQGRTTVAGSKRNTGFIAEGVDFDKLNQLLFELRADHIIGDATQLSNNDCTCVFQSSDQTFRDSQGAVVTFLDGEKIIWAGLDTITASIDISTIDDLTHETLTGVTIALGSYDLSLGENQRGELDLSGTGTLTILSSDGLRVKNSGVTIDNQGGDITVDNVMISPTLDFSADSKGIFDGLEAVIYRLVVSIAGSDDPLGASGSEWEVADDTSVEDFLGASGTSLIIEGDGAAVDGEFVLQKTGYFLCTFSAFADGLNGGEGCSYTFQIDNAGGGYNTLARFQFAANSATGSGGVAHGSLSVLFKIPSDPTNYKFKISAAATGTVNSTGDPNFNETHFSLIRLAGI